MSLLHMKIIKKKENKRKTRLMLNIEKYKKEVIARLDTCQMERMINDITGFNYCGSARDHCTPCAEYVYKWLLSEYKEQILDDVEKKYLSEVIRPFKKEVATISKFHTWDNAKQYICIELKDKSGSNLPCFPKDTMYKGMKETKHYTLEELGL